MCPPLIITHAQIDEMIAIIRRSLDQCEAALRAGEVQPHDDTTNNAIS